MTFVQRQDAVGAMAVGEDDQRRIGQTQAHVTVPTYELGGALYVLRAERFQPVRASGNFIQDRELRLVADAAGQEVVELGEDEWGQDERTRLRVNDPLDVVMQMLRRVDVREQSAGVDDDQRPNSASASSTRSARWGSSP